MVIVLKCSCLIKSYLALPHSYRWSVCDVSGLETGGACGGAAVGTHAAQPTGRVWAGPLVRRRHGAPKHKQAARGAFMIGMQGLSHCVMGHTVMITWTLIHDESHTGRWDIPTSLLCRFATLSSRVT